MSEKKPVYRKFSKQITVLTLVWAMGIATIALIYRPDLYAASMTWVVPLILGVIGAYQGIGHADLRTTLKEGPPRQGPEEE